MPLVVALLTALAAGLLALLAGRALTPSSATPTRPTDEAARAVGRALRPRSAWATFLARRLDREVASGFLLTIALAVVVGGGLVLGVLAVLVRRPTPIQHVDHAAAAWGFDHRAATSTAGLRAVTELGDIRIVVVLAILLGLADLRWQRGRGRWAVAFLFVVLGGMELAQIGIKGLVDRVRPTLEPEAAKLGPSFPSGHSATAAAFYAAAALILGRYLSRRVRHALAAAAIAIAVGVAASRVLLDLHWLSDVVGGLALGWAWFALSAVVFGGRLLIPTAATDVMATETARGTAVSSRRNAA
jgi:undecaprenyl-diphosphatase